MLRPLLLFSFTVLGLGCYEGSSGDPTDSTASVLLPPNNPLNLTEAPEPVDDSPQLGEPLLDLTDEELAAFKRGKILFEKRFKPSEGLGPFYNATSCSSCHSKPVPGGSSDLYRNFYVAAYGSAFSQGAIPPFLSVVVPAYGSGALHSETTEFTLEGRRPDIPETQFGLPVMSAQRNSIPIFGVGLFESISDATILANADPFDTITPDGISGRVNMDGASIGRLGLKAQSNNIELFTRGPLQFQMGITSNPFLGHGATVSAAAAQVSSDPNDPSSDVDPVPDPEISHEDLGDLIAFSRFLAPPGRRQLTGGAKAGEGLFDTTGCTKCHIPTLPSSRGPVSAYTDLLIHYMGTELADLINFGDASGTTGGEFRTQPLWGLTFTGPYLHDGRAVTINEAIEAHAGEAQTARDAYAGLTQDQRDDIVSFLEHL